VGGEKNSQQERGARAQNTVQLHKQNSFLSYLVALGKACSFAERTGENFLAGATETFIFFKG
jgi:hypothetical protein